MRTLTLLSGLVASPASPLAAVDGRAPFDSGAISGLGITEHRFGGDERPHRRDRRARRRRRQGDACSSARRAAASGSSLDSGTTFTPVFDKQPVQSIGAIAIDPSNPQTVWVGTGESWTRNSVSIGDGIYKSTDGGDTWMHMGLPESERIARIAVHPSERQTPCYACVPGQAVERLDGARRSTRRPTAARPGRSCSRAATSSTGCAARRRSIPTNPDRALCGAVGLPAQGLDVPLRRRFAGRARAAAACSVSSDGGQHVDVARRRDGEGIARRSPGAASAVTRRAVGQQDASTRSSSATRSALFVSDDGGKTLGGARPAAR